jgi:hypothetical protein
MQVGSLGQLSHFYAWNCSFSRLPTELGEASSLIALDFSDNRLAGALPVSLARLKWANTAYFDSIYSQVECPLAPAVRSWLSNVTYTLPLC